MDLNNLDKVNISFTQRKVARKQKEKTYPSLQAEKRYIIVTKSTLLLQLGGWQKRRLNMLMGVTPLQD